MPEVINLVSSTPPAPSNPDQHAPGATTPFGRSIPGSPHLFTSDPINDSLFEFDDFDDKPAKRRRISNESNPRNTATTVQPVNDLFLFSDDDFPLPPTAGPSNSKTSTWNPEGSDPIVFTSSAPDPARGQSVLQKRTEYSRTESITIDDDDDGNAQGDGVVGFSDPFQLPEFNELSDPDEDVSHKAHSSFSSRTASLLAGLESRPKDVGAGGSGWNATKRSRKVKEIITDELDEPERPKPVRKTSKLTAEEKEARARQREAAKAQREREKQLEKKRKQKLKEEKAREKQLAADISEVNKLKVDKKNSTPEMIVDLASSMEGTSVANQTAEYMKRLDVECTFFPSEISNIVRWRRKVVAKFNESVGYWEPCPPYIAQEEHVLCLLTAQEFVEMVITPSAETETDDLELHVAKLKSTHPNCKPIYLIEGLTAWMRKNKNSRNRAFQAEVLRQMQPPENPNPSSRPRKKSNNPESTPLVDDDTIEDALLTLQVSHACLIHHTNAPAESADWIKNFTEHVSTIPYRRERMEGNDAAFCMDNGQVKTGDDKSDTFVKMLQEVNRITASMAYGIIASYPSVTDLIRGFKVHGPAMLEDVRVWFCICVHLWWLTGLEIRQQKWRPNGFAYRSGGE